MVNSLALFSSNEELSEVPTSELRFLLLPAFLGDLFLKQMGSDRMTTLNIAKIYFVDYLKRCKNYGVTDKDLSRYIETSNTPEVTEKSINQMTNSRQEKIARYKEQKEQERSLKGGKGLSNDAQIGVIGSIVLDIPTNMLRHLSEQLIGEFASTTLGSTMELRNILKESSSADEDTQRSYYVLLLKLWVNKAVEHLSSLHSEMEILEHMKTMKGKEGDSNQQNKPPDAKPQQSFKPILITREMIKDKVFGAGYPSVPTMSQEEFLEKEILEGKVVLEYKGDQKQEKKKSDDESDSEDDPAKLQKKRDWDEWKDDHRRGWGNRENMG
ncbi:hypothetical protein ACROYT_G025349 [Oculina patagonica]